MDERNDYNSIPMQHTKTAIEWLIEQCPRIETIVAYNVLEEAKQIEKEQIMKAVDRGFDEGCKFPEDMSLSNSEQYYNETYHLKSVVKQCQTR